MFSTFCVAEQAVDNYDALLEKARSRGSVAVIVGLKIGGYKPEGGISDPAVAQSQRNRIEKAQNELLSSLSSFNPGNVKKFASIPYMAFSINEAGLEVLRASPIVESVTEDKAVKPSSN